MAINDNNIWWTSIVVVSCHVIDWWNSHSQQMHCRLLREFQNTVHAFDMFQNSFDIGIIRTFMTRSLLNLYIVYPRCKHFNLTLYCVSIMSSVCSASPSPTMFSSRMNTHLRASILCFLIRHLSSVARWVQPYFVPLFSFGIVQFYTIDDLHSFQLCSSEHIRHTSFFALDSATKWP